MTIVKVVLFSDGVAELKVRLTTNDELRIPKASLELFQETLRLPENITLTRKLARPEPFRTQLVGHPNDVFIITTPTQAYEGLVYLENGLVYIQEGAKTVQVGLADIQAVENVTKIEAEVYQALQEGEISFCVRFENTQVTATLSDAGLFQIDLRFTNSLGLPINGEFMLANRDYGNGTTYVTDFGVCGHLSDMGVETAKEGAEDWKMGERTLQKEIFRIFKAKVPSYRGQLHDGVAYFCQSADNLQTLLKQFQQCFPESKIRLDAGETLRRCVHQLQVPVKPWRGCVLQHGAKRVKLHNIVEAQFPSCLWPVRLGSQWVFPRSDMPVLLEQQEISGQFVDCTSEAHWSGTIKNWVANIDVAETITLVPTTVPCLCVYFLRYRENISFDDNLNCSFSAATSMTESCVQRQDLSEKEQVTPGSEQNAIRRFPGSQIVLLELRHSGPAVLKSTYKQAVELKGFTEIVDLVSEIQQHGHSITWDHERLQRKVLDLTGPYLKQLPHETLRDVILDLDFEESQDMKNTAIKHYLEENKMVPPFKELRDLLKQRSMTAQSINVTKAQIEKTKEDSTRLLEQIKALGSNRILLKTSRVLDSFTRDLRECEVKIQILEQRLISLQAKLQMLDTDIAAAEDAVKVIF